jgi:hypothetical protein
MKQFMAIFLGTRAAYDAFRALPEAERQSKEQAGMQEWMKWATENKNNIVFEGSPLGKTKKIDKTGITDTANELGAFVVVQAETHDDAAKMFLNHPHFMIFPGDRVEVMECLPIPQMQ